MSILIKGVDLSEKDDKIELLIDYYTGYVYRLQYDEKFDETMFVRIDGAQAVPVPTPHGRLIEERVAYDTIAEAAFELDHLDMDTVDKGLSCTPTVIESEE